MPITGMLGRPLGALDSTSVGALAIKGTLAKALAALALDASGTRPAATLNKRLVTLAATGAGTTAITASVDVPLLTLTTGGAAGGLPATAAPLLLLPHRWPDPVEIVYSWPTAIVETREWSEQRLALTLAPQEKVTYQYLVTNPEDITAASEVVWRVLAETDPALKALVQLPRWEEAGMLVASVLAGDTSLPVVESDPQPPHWVSGTSYLLYDALTGATEVVVGGAVTTTAVACSALAGAWPVGTLLIPLSNARLVDTMDGTRETGVIGQGSYTCLIDAPLAGNTVAAGAGSAQVPLVAYLTLKIEPYEWVVNSKVGYQLLITAICRDAMGNLVNPSAPLVWTLNAAATTYGVFRTLNASGTKAVFEQVLSTGGIVAAIITAMDPTSGLHVDGDIHIEMT